MSKKMIIHLCIFTATLFGLMNSVSAASDKTVTSKTIVRKKTITYRQWGRHYRVLPSSKNYQEKGIASWYGHQFHRRRTSSGERFNMYQLTAAHKTLPLATRVVVTNLVNGRKVIVRVNDRGPFVGDRLIDLSYGAAKQLGMVGRGLAPVHVKAIT